MASEAGADELLVPGSHSIRVGLAAALAAALLGAASAAADSGATARATAVVVSGHDFFMAPRLDPWRRFDQLYPSLSADLHGALQHPTIEAAIRLLGIAERELRPIARPKLESGQGGAADRYPG